MREGLLALLLSFLLSAAASATTYEFDILARIDGASLRNPSDQAKVIEGGTLLGRMTFSDPPTFQFGGTYQYAAGLETLSIATPEGFELALSNQIVSIGNSGGTGFFTSQSFVSEDPNGWNLVVDIIAPAWVDDDDSLPTSFPTTFDYAYLSAYFTDEGEWVQVIDATILAITPANVPLPASGVLLVFAGACLVGGRRLRKLAKWRGA